MFASSIVHSSVFVSLVYMVLVNWCGGVVQSLPFSSSSIATADGASPAGARSLMELMRMANAGSEFENFEKRRSRELFGKRSAPGVEGGYDRFSRRSHELFGKRSDPEMAIREEEDSDPAAFFDAEKFAELPSVLEQDEEASGQRGKDSAIVNFLIISGYPSHFANSKQLIQKLRERALMLKNQESNDQPTKMIKRRNRELFGKRSTIAPGAPLDEADLDESNKLSESQLNALISFLNAAKHQQPRQRRARGGELFG